MSVTEPFAVSRTNEGSGDQPSGEVTRTARRKYSTVIAAGITLLGLLVLWWGIARLGIVRPLFLPPPEAVFARFVSLLSHDYVGATLGEHLVATFLRIVAALAIAVIVFVPVGIAMGATSIGRGIFDPLIEFIRPVPPLAYLPLIVIWFGIGEESKVIVIIIAMIAPIAIATAAGVTSASAERINAARSIGARRFQVLWHVLLPSALPSILTGIRIALGAGWTTVVAAELIGAQRGLGHMIQSASQFLVTDVVVMGIFVISSAAIVLDWAIRAIQRRLVPWSGHG